MSATTAHASLPSAACGDWLAARPGRCSRRSRIARACAGAGASGSPRSARRRCGEGLAFSTLVRRPRRPAAAALHHAGRPLAAAGDARGRRSALPRRCCSPTRTSASARITASIRWRSARAVCAAGHARPHRLRRLDPHHAGGAAARAARRAQLQRPSCARWCARSSSSARSSKDEILALYLSLAPYGGNLEGVRAASLAYFGKEPRRLTLGRGGAAGGAAAIAGARRPDRSVDAARSARDRVLDRVAAAGIVPAGRDRARQGTSRCRTGAGRCRCWRRMRPTRRSRRRPTRASIASPSTRALQTQPRGAGARARPRARARHVGRDPRGRSCDRRGAARASPRPTISTAAAPARST